MDDIRSILSQMFDAQSAQPVNLYGASDIPQMPWQQQPQTDVAPQNLSQRIQEVLGAKPANQGGTVSNILSSRFNTDMAGASDLSGLSSLFDGGPSYGDYAQGVVQSALGKPEVGQNNSDLLKKLSTLSELQKNMAMAQLYQSGGSGNQTLKIAQGLMNENPSLSLADAVAVVKSSGTVPLTVGRNGEAVNLPGSVNAASNMAGAKQQAEKSVDLAMNPQIKYQEGVSEQNAKSDMAATSTLPIIDQLRQFNAGTFEMPYADTAPVRGYSRIFGSADQQAKQQNMDLLRQARTDLAAPLAKELGVNPTDRDFQATLDRIFDSNASQKSRAAQIDSLEQRILARKAARAGKQTPAAHVNTVNWIIQNGKLVPAQ